MILSQPQPTLRLVFYELATLAHCLLWQLICNCNALHLQKKIK